ncbi:MAG TPA: 4,5-DOPA dioxygenase extradiol [Steroidobacteraceae bacterium]|nr:4,5-DOPA dioxygenase extradiol [Steroidobacteraceae bacterium]
MSRLPVLFIGHGSPLTAFEDNKYTQGWTSLVNGIKPRAVLCISAHWCTSGAGVTAMSSPRTIHDFYGFPEHLYQFQYPAPGDPQLARRIAEILAPLNVHQDQQWGLDHGCWAVMKHLYPQADVPVVQLSIDMNREAHWHHDIGRQLSVLRDEGVLILGSGNVVHNLRRIQFPDAAPAYDWAVRFNQQVRQCIESRDVQPLIDYQAGDEALRQAAMLSIPMPDHYFPLLYVLGASDERDAIDVSLDDIVLGSISMMCVKLG